jgi:hypothetical protein
VYDSHLHELIAFHKKGYEMVCPSGSHCIVRTANPKSKFTLMFQTLVAWGAGDKAKEDGFTMCMEKFENNDIRRVLAFWSELMIVVLQ